MMYVPDNYDAFDYFESEQARHERIKYREEIEEEIPFYEEEAHGEYQTTKTKRN